jgi:hypothetical protein
MKITSCFSIFLNNEIISAEATRERYEPFYTTKCISLLFAIGIVFIITSCNRYIDSANSIKKTSIADGTFYFYADSNFLHYKNKIGLSRDKQVSYPKAFEVALPKHIRHYFFSSSQEFYFYYDNNQTIFININLEDNEPVSDSFYVPDKIIIDNLISKSIISSREKYNINKISFNPGRKQAIIRKGDATILLYNIKEKNYIDFLTLLSNFKLVKIGEGTSPVPENYNSDS